MIISTFPSPSTESPVLSKPVPVPVPRLTRVPPVPAPQRLPTAAPRKLKKNPDAQIVNTNDDQGNTFNSEVAIEDLYRKPDIPSGGRRRKEGSKENDEIC